MSKIKLLAIFLGVMLLASCGKISKNADLLISKEESIENASSENRKNNSQESKSNDEIFFNLTELDTLDLDGNHVDSSILEGKYTLINVWATYCRPCIVEMPDLQRLNENLGGDEFQVIGILSNAYVDSEENLETAKNIVKKTEVNYINLLPNDKIINDVLINIQFVPTSFIIDSDGNQVGDIVHGMKNYEFFEEWVKSIK